MRIEGWPHFRNHPEKPGVFIITEGFSCVYRDEVLKVEAGLHVNGASIPKPFTLFFDRWHPHYNRPSVLHDALVGEYGEPVKVVDVDCTERELSWKEAAVWFREAMKAEGANTFKARMFYHAVMRFKDVQRVFKK